LADYLQGTNYCLLLLLSNGVLITDCEISGAFVYADKLHDALSHHKCRIQTVTLVNFCCHRMPNVTDLSNLDTVHLGVAVKLFQLHGVLGTIDRER